MKNFWGSVLGPLLGAVVAGAAGWFACLAFLPGDRGEYATGDFVLAALVAAAGAAVGAAIASVLGGRNGGAVLGAAIVVALGGTIGFLVPWVIAAAGYDETGLFVVGAAMIAAVGLVVLGVVALLVGWVLTNGPLGPRPEARGGQL